MIIADIHECLIWLFYTKSSETVLLSLWWLIKIDYLHRKLLLASEYATDNHPLWNIV